VPADDPQLGFGRDLLRGMVLEATAPGEARPAWVALVARARRPYEREAAELALARFDERQGQIARVFASGSPITTPILRKRLLGYVAGPELLRAQARQGRTPDERELALFVLLYKELSRGRYAEFLRDLSLMPPADGQPSPGFYDLLAADRQPFDLFRSPTPGELSCPPLRATAATLARTPADQRAQLCLADFFRGNGFDRFPLESEPPQADTLGGSAPAFPGKPYARMSVYRAIIGSSTATPDDRAYALYRAVNCYAPSGSSACGGDDVPRETRRDWFRELKSRYPQSRWAKSLRYYW
jgi:hypothetical protein